MASTKMMTETLKEKKKAVLLNSEGVEEATSRFVEASKAEVVMKAIEEAMKVGVAMRAGEALKAEEASKIEACVEVEVGAMNQEADSKGEGISRIKEVVETISKDRDLRIVMVKNLNLEDFSSFKKHHQEVVE